MAVKWYVHMKASPIDIMIVEESLNATGYTLHERPEGTYLLVPEITDANDFTVARDRAKAELSVINGLLKAYHPDAEPIEYGGLIYLDDDGTVRVPHDHQPARAGARGYAKPVLLNADGSEIPQPRPELEDWLKLAGREDVVRRVARFFAYPSDWFNLYKVYEEICKDVGGVHKAESLGWIDRQEHSDFRLTANSYEAAGEAARHSMGANNPSPKNGPMSLETATSLMRTFIQAWLRHRTGQGSAGATTDP